MKIAKTVGIAGFLIGILASASAQTAGPEAGVPAPTAAAPKLTATIFVSNSNSVTAYAPGSNGNVAPVAAISDRSNMLEMPWGIALDSRANIYVANYGGGFAGIGAITVYPAGSSDDTAPIATIIGPRTGLDSPFGIAVDSSGKIYVANFIGGRGTGSVTVYPAGSNGNVAPIATIIGADTGLDNPSGIAVDSSGKIYVANRGGGLSSASSITVYAAGSNGNVKPIATIAGPNTALDDPCIAVDSSGKIYAGNASDSITVYPAGSSGNVKPIATITGPDTGDKTGLSQLNAIALDSKGNIYAANAADSTINPNDNGFNVTVYRPGSNGNVKPITTLRGSAIGAEAIAVDSSGKVYVTTQFNQDTYNDISGTVTVLSPLGKGEGKTIATIYTTGKTGLRGDDSMALDSKGNIYVTSASGGSDYNGYIAVFAAGHYGNVPPIRIISGANSKLHWPQAITVDAGGNIYVSNTVTGPITGSITVYAAGSNGDAAPIATITGDNTQIQNLSATALDSIGNLYGGNRCTKDSSGKVYTTGGSSSGGEVAIYPRDVTSKAVITGPKTGLAGPQGIAVDSNGYIYVVNNGLSYNDGAVTPFAVTTPRVTIYSPGSHGNVEPVATISGTLTGLNQPNGIAVGPPVVSP